MDPLVGVGLAAAAFAAGAINSVAGGGSLVSFPALVAAGYPAKTANVTNTTALLPGYLGGVLGYRPELGHQRGRLKALAAVTIAGSLAGSMILLSTPESAFDAIVPFLILFACVLMTFQDRLARWAASHKLAAQGDANVPAALHGATFLLAVYGAYFGAGLGILSLAVLTILLPGDIQLSNALKNALSFAINIVAVCWFAVFGPVAWLPAVIMAGGALAGGYLGVGLARRLGRKWLRISVVSYGLVVAAVLFAT